MWQIWKMCLQVLCPCILSLMNSLTSNRLPLGGLFFGLNVSPYLSHVSLGQSDNNKTDVQSSTGERQSLKTTEMWEYVNGPPSPRLIYSNHITISLFFFGIENINIFMSQFLNGYGTFFSY